MSRPKYTLSCGDAYMSAHRYGLTVECEKTPGTWMRFRDGECQVVDTSEPGDKWGEAIWFSDEHEDKARWRVVPVTLKTKKSKRGAK